MSKKIDDSFTSRTRPAISARLQIFATSLTITGFDFQSQPKSVTGEIVFLYQEKDFKTSWRADFQRNTWTSSVKTDHSSNVDEVVRQFIDDRLSALNHLIVQNVEGIRAERTRPIHLAFA